MDLRENVSWKNKQILQLSSIPYKVIDYDGNLCCGQPIWEQATFSKVVLQNWLVLSTHFVLTVA